MYDRRSRSRSCRDRGGDRDRSGDRGGRYSPPPSYGRGRDRGGDRERSGERDRGGGRERGGDRGNDRCDDRDRDRGRDRNRDREREDDADPNFKCTIEGPGATPPSRNTENCYRAVVEMKKPGDRPGNLGTTGTVRMTCAWLGDKRSAERDAEKLRRAWRSGGFDAVQKVKGELRAAARK
mmetsp:Transcript_88501/g.245864  ORF Transcript_88501/g.245864 Transcript_88501/m.245864 type:complete len:180 (-) Transcript_88501:185-724(-)